MTGMMLRRLTTAGLLVVALAASVASGQQRAEGVTEGDKGWTVNIRNADIQAFITQVAEMTGRNFVVDPRVRSRDVTVISQQALSDEEVYQLFLSVLQVHGYAAVPSGDVTKIVPNTTAKQSNLPLTQDGPDQGEELITRVISVDDTPVEELVPVLRPLVPQYGHLAAVGSANALIISDHMDNIRRIEAILGQIDGAESEEVEVIDLENAFAGDLVKLLENLTPAGGGRRQNQESGLTLVADERTNRLIIKGDRASRERIRNLVRELDVAQSTASGVKVIRLAHADAKSTAELLKNFAQSAPAAAGGEGAAKAARGGDQNGISIQADESINALVIRAEPAVMKELRSVISQLDVRRAQVLIEAAIVEISGGKGLDLGFQYAAGDEEEGVGAINFSNFGISVNQVIAALRSDEVTSGLGDGITVGGGQEDENGDFEWGGFVQALATTSNVNLLSTPSILTLDNQEASIIVGQNVPFVTGQSTNTGSGVSNPFQTIQREDVGLELTVTPHLADLDSIRLELKQETSDVVPSSQTQVQSADIITTKRSIETTVLARHRETIVLGGLIKDDVRESVSKVPLLGDIPLLGKLFSSTSKQREKSNLMVFLRPTILENDEALVNLTRRKYLGVTALHFRVNRKGELERVANSPLPAEPSELFEGRDGPSASMHEYLDKQIEAQRQSEPAEAAADPEQDETREEDE
jgi:general secretion pathway protein D